MITFLCDFDKCHWVEYFVYNIHHKIMSKKDLKKLGNKIKNIRKSKNLSQEKFAELVGKSRNYIGMVERAELNMPVDMVFTFAKTLKIEPKTFFEF